MLNLSSFRTTDVGPIPKGIARSVRGRSLPDPNALLHRADVPGHLDAAMDAASGVVRDAIQRLPGQHRQRRRPVLVAAGLLVGVIAVIGVAGWLVRRRMADTPAERNAEDQGFNQAALDRATNEGMPVVTGVNEALPHPNGEVRELTAVSDLA